MGGAYNRNGRRKDSIKGFKRKLPYSKTSGRPRIRWVHVVQRDALQLLGMRGGGVELQVGMNVGVL
jgi:hypothetical protein